MRRPLTGKRAANRVAKLTVGTPVRYLRDDGTVTLTEVRMVPWQLGDGSWVVAVRGFAGGIAMERMTVDRARMTEVAA